jgi:hypothetical protein
MFKTIGFTATYKTVVELDKKNFDVTSVEEDFDGTGATQTHLIIETDLDDESVFLKQLGTVVDDAATNVMRTIGTIFTPNGFDTGILANDGHGKIRLNRTELHFVHRGLVYVLIVNYFAVDRETIEVITHLRPY